MFLLTVCIIVRGNVVLTDSCSRANGFPVNIEQRYIAAYSGIAFYDIGKLSMSTNVYEYDILFRWNVTFIIKNELTTRY